MTRPKRNYKKHLESDYFQQVRHKVKMRDHFACVLCGEMSGIEIHHISYNVDGKSIVGKELEFLNWLVCLCRNCHDRVHLKYYHFFNPSNEKRIDYYQFNENREKLKQSRK